jgi:hypothetical protein
LIKNVHLATKLKFIARGFYRDKLDAFLSPPSEAMDSEHFLPSRIDVAEHFNGRKQYFLESFYRMIRKRFSILLENGPDGNRGSSAVSLGQNKTRITLPPIEVFVRQMVLILTRLI